MNIYSKIDYICVETISNSTAKIYYFFYGIILMLFYHFLLYFAPKPLFHFWKTTFFPSYSQIKKCKKWNRCSFEIWKTSVSQKGSIRTDLLLKVHMISGIESWKTHFWTLWESIGTLFYWKIMGFFEENMVFKDIENWVKAKLFKKSTFLHSFYMTKVLKSPFFTDFY